LSVGAPLLTKAMTDNILFASLFLLSFYVFLVGSKIGIAILVGRWKSFLAGNAYIYTVRILGVTLCIFSIILFKDGFKLLGVF